MFSSTLPIWWIWKLGIIGAILGSTDLKKKKFTILCPSGQYLVKRSHSVRGMVKVHRRRLLTPRLATNIFLGVRSTFKQNTWNIYEYSNWSSLFLLSEWAATNYFQKILIELSNNRVRWVWHGQINQAWKWKIIPLGYGYFCSCPTLCLTHWVWMV